MTLGGEFLRHISPSSVITAATGAGSAFEGANLAKQDLIINAGRAQLENSLSVAGAAVAVLGVLFVGKDYLNYRRAQRKPVTENTNPQS